MSPNPRAGCICPLTRRLPACCAWETPEASKAGSGVSGRAQARRRCWPPVRECRLLRSGVAPACGGQAFPSCWRDLRLFFGCRPFFLPCRPTSFESYALSGVPRGPLGWPVPTAPARGRRPAGWFPALAADSGRGSCRRGPAEPAATTSQGWAA